MSVMDGAGGAVHRNVVNITRRPTGAVAGSHFYAPAAPHCSY